MNRPIAYMADGQVTGVAMPEIEPTLHVPIQDQGADYDLSGRNQRGFNRIRGLVAGAALFAAAGAGAVGVTAFNDGGTKTEAAAAHDVQDGRNGEACIDHLDFSAHYADHTYGGPESLYPSLNRTDKKGKSELVDTDVAKERVRSAICGDTRALAVLDSVLELRKDRQLPSAATILRMKQLNDTYVANPKAAKDAAKRVYGALDYLTPTQDFAVTSGQATEIQTVRKKNGDIERIESQTIESNGTYEGFKIGFNHDDKDLTPFDEALRAKLQELILISGDGTVIINQLIGEGGFNVDKELEKQKVSPEDNQADVKAGSSEKNDGGGHFGKRNGNGESDQPGSVPESGGGGGHQPGEQPSFGGEKPGTSTTTRPTTTTTRPTTTTTRPTTTTTTRPTTTTTTRPPVTTTTTLPKGPDPGCVPPAPCE